MTTEQPDTTVLTRFMRSHQQFRQAQRAEDMEGGKQGGKRRYMRAMIRLLLESEDGLSIADLAEALKIAPKRVIGIGKRLEKQDLITADQLEDDVIVISATEKLRTNHTNRKAKNEDMQAKLFAEFSEEEITQFNQYLERMMNNIDAIEAASIEAKKAADVADDEEADVSDDE